MAAGRYRVAVFLRPIPIGSMHGMFTYIWLICMINVGKYTIHRSYWICNLFEVLFWCIQFVILGVWRTPFLGPLVKTILVQPSANQNCSPQGVRPLLFGDDPCFRLAIEFSTHLLQLLFEVKSGTCGNCLSQKVFFVCFFPFFLVDKRRHVP